MKPFTRAEKVRIAVVMIATACLLVVGFILLTREKAKADASWVEAGNQELLDPQGFYHPYSQLQVGRNCYENLIHGTSYTEPYACGYEDEFNAMVEYHAQRLALFSYVFSDGAFCFDHDTAVMVIVTALRYGIDYRVCIPILLFESSMTLGSSNYYGTCGAWSVGGSFANQTERCFARFAEWGNNPELIFAMWHNGDGYWDTYVGNCMEVYRGCDGGDLQ